MTQNQLIREIGSDMKFLFFALLFIIFIGHGSCQDGKYILYCPCMGRFGNQAEQLLGTLKFGKLLNRTVVLPPFISHENRSVKFIPFQDVIDVKAVEEYTPVITLDAFMKDVAPVIWKPRERMIFCYSHRNGRDTESCNALEGSPFGHFWRQIGVNEFSSSVFYSPLTLRHEEASMWVKDYARFPVLAFVAAPSQFPVDQETTELQKFIKFSDEPKKSSKEYMKKRQLDDPFIGIHWRHGIDWKRACNLLKESDLKVLFSSGQCFPGTSLKGIPFELCFQTPEQVIRELEDILTTTSITTIYFATDEDDREDFLLIYKSLSKRFPSITLLTPSTRFSSRFPSGIKKEPTPTFIQDLVILSEADYFLGNCISSFSAFVSRTRKWNGLQNTVFLSNKIKHRLDDEL